MGSHAARLATTRYSHHLFCLRDLSVAVVFRTAYGRALLIKYALIGGLLITSAIHMGILRPRLKKEYQKYSYVADRLQVVQAGVERAEQNRASTLNGQQAVTMTAEPVDPQNCFVNR